MKHYFGLQITLINLSIMIICSFYKYIACVGYVGNTIEYHISKTFKHCYNNDIIIAEKSQY